MSDKRIKLVVSDLDGTLLNSQGQLPQKFAQTVQCLADKEIVFATASGRTWKSQKALFAGSEEQMTFICDNGAYIVHKGQLIFISEIETDVWKRVVQKCAGYDAECGAVVCGVKGDYMIQNPVINPVVSQFYSDINYVKTFDEVDDQIFKISVCCAQGITEEMLNNFQQSFSEDASLVSAHPQFIDIMNFGISKASGVSLLQKALGLEADQTMVFGDYNNDIEMLKAAGISYVMENAPVFMREYATFIAPSNENDGVISVLENTLLKEQSHA